MDDLTDPEAAQADAAGLAPLVLVTGPSGAGRKTAVSALEDIGFEVIDNLPLSMFERLLKGPDPERPLALGIDVRNRDFTTQAFIEAIDGIAQLTDLPMQLLYLDARADVLLRRYSETRRRHPLAPDESAALGVERELDLLTPIRARADILIDTSELSPNDLRTELERWFSVRGDRALAVSVHSFSYKRGLPRGADLVLDCRFLDNPHWEPSLRDRDGLDRDVQAYVARDTRFADFRAQVGNLARLLLPAYAEGGKAYLSIAFGCTGGQHRSVTMAETLAADLAKDGWPVSIRHRELERRAASAAGAVPERKD